MGQLVLQPPPRGTGTTSRWRPRGVERTSCSWKAKVIRRNQVFTCTHKVQGLKNNHRMWNYFWRKVFGKRHSTRQALSRYGLSTGFQNLHSPTLVAADVGTVGMPDRAIGVAVVGCAVSVAVFASLVAWPLEREIIGKALKGRRALGGRRFCVLQLAPAVAALAPRVLDRRRAAIEDEKRTHRTCRRGFNSACGRLLLLFPLPRASRAATSRRNRKVAKRFAFNRKTGFCFSASVAPPLLPLL